MSASKTTLSCPGGLTLGFGGGPGLASGFYWNRIGSLFSCYRPSIARLHVFELSDLHQPLALRLCSQHWEPNLLNCRYEAGDLILREEKSVSETAIGCVLSLEFKPDSSPRELLLFFHGSAEQWPFFDYDRRRPIPTMRCQIDPKNGAVVLQQPHPHAGCDELETIQRVQAGPRFASFGFLRSEAELNTLWAEHGALASLRQRLGQVGGRLDPSKHASSEHTAPCYYFSLRVKVEANKPARVNLSCGFNVAEHSDAQNTPPLEVPQPRRHSSRIAAAERHAWKTYLNQEVPQLDCNDPQLRRYWYYVWYVLRANRCHAGEHIRHPYTAPSKYMYWGPWIWDGFFHVLGEQWLRDGETAKDSIRAVLAMQFPNGFIPVCSGTDRRMCFHEDVEGYKIEGGGGYASYLPFRLDGYEELEHPFETRIAYTQPATGESESITHNEKTQTPLITLAAAAYVELHEDYEFAAEVLPALRSYDDWLWRRRRDRENRFVLWHGDESGWDNATRHYPVPALPFDVQVHCALHREALLKLERLNCEPDAKRIAETEERLRLTSESLASYRDPDDHWHYDQRLNEDGSTSPRTQIAASGLFALLLDCDPSALESCLSALADPQRFGTEYPVPTLSANDPDYAPHGWGWNGPAWLQVNYFVIVGLLSNGRVAEAMQLWEKTRRFLIRDGEPYSYELYDPETGEGIGCPDYSWQAMFINLIIRYFAGIKEGIIGPLPIAWELALNLSNLAGPVEAIQFSTLNNLRSISLELRRTGGIFLDLSLIPGAVEVTANGEAMQGSESGHWSSSGLKPARHWEIIIKCI